MVTKQMNKKLLKKCIEFIKNKKILRVIPDYTYLKLVYKYHMKKKLNLKNPKTFNEKLQWLKLYDRKDIYTKMVDKYEAKKYVSDILSEEYIIPTIGVYDSFDEIDFEKLPEQFVMKCTHDSGGLVICKDKKTFDIEKARNKITKCLKRNYYYFSREWPYKNVKPRIIIEKYMSDSKQKVLKDYKFYCFNGIPKYLYVSEGLDNHKTAKISFFDMDFNFAPFKRKDYEPFQEKPEKPVNFANMIELAKILSKDIKFLRVDFYEINNKIYFSELTFSPCAGYMPFDPEEYDYKLGQMINLDTK